MRTHNGLLVGLPGADGMKTGFICKFGFNVVATATRDRRKLIAVVLGEPSVASRTTAPPTSSRAVSSAISGNRCSARGSRFKPR